jgi:hypothetical protein
MIVAIMPNVSLVIHHGIGIAVSSLGIIIGLRAVTGSKWCHDQFCRYVWMSIGSVGVVVNMFF